MSFPASYDFTTRIVSAVVLLVLIAAAVFTQSAVVAGLAVLLMAVCYAYSPRSYTIADRSIVVNRLIGNVTIPLDGVREVRPVSRQELRGCLRLWGSGGLFGYYGIFQMPRLGRAAWYLTNRDNSVAVVSAAKTALFSPDDVDNFMAAIQAAVPVSQTSTEVDATQIRSSRSAGFVARVVGATIGLAVIAFVAFAFLYSPGLPAYTLTPDALVIHDRFYPVTVSASSVDVDHIRVVDLAADSEWRPTARTNGFANSHYHSGWFRLANGQKIRVYVANGTRLVLLPPQGDGVPILFEARDPDKFVTDLRQEWSPHS